jgi:hypothetical protein
MPKETNNRNNRAMMYLVTALLVLALGWSLLLSFHVGDAAALGQVNTARLDAYHEDIKAIKADVKQILTRLPRAEGR